MAKPIILKVASEKPLTKLAMLKLISDNANLSLPVIKEIFEDYQRLLFSELDRVQEASVLEMGKIKVKRTEPRMGRNPFTGEQVQITAKTKLKFVFSKKYKDFASSLFE